MMIQWLPLLEALILQFSFVETQELTAVGCGGDCGWNDLITLMVSVHITAFPEQVLIVNMGHFLLVGYLQASVYINIQIIASWSAKISFWGDV